MDEKAEAPPRSNNLILQQVNFRSLFFLFSQREDGTSWQQIFLLRIPNHPEKEDLFPNPNILQLQKKEKEAVQKKTPQNPNWSRGSELIAMHKASFSEFPRNFSTVSKSHISNFFSSRILFFRAVVECGRRRREKKIKNKFCWGFTMLWEVGGALGLWLLASPSARLNLSEISAELGGDQIEGRGAFT